MFISGKISEVKSWIKARKSESKIIGFVPTMGALHQGHLSLIKRCKKECDCTVVSIFVNRIQFNNKNDFDKYPRVVKEDIMLLKESACDLVFCPDEDEMFPEPPKEIFDLGSLNTVMEGKFRPGHFNGVVTVVKKLFEIVSPDKAFFGLKDFQQLAVIKKMVKDFSINVEIIECETVRESDGLAMSSRNMNLSPYFRKNASNISKILFEARNLSNAMSPLEVKKYVIDKITENSDFSLEYFEIINSDSLKNVSNWTEKPVIGCIAVYTGGVRLIDNIKFN